MKKLSPGTSPKSSRAAPDTVLGELWSVKAALNKSAGYDVARLATQANKFTAPAAVLRVLGRKRLAA